MGSSTTDLRHAVGRATAVLLITSATLVAGAPFDPSQPVPRRSDAPPATIIPEATQAPLEVADTSLPTELPEPGTDESIPVRDSSSSAPAVVALAGAVVALVAAWLLTRRRSVRQ